MNPEALIRREDLEGWAKAQRGAGKRIVFTNGCYDLLHPGHVALLEAAAAEGDVLIVAINSDESVGRLKGDHRPVYPERDRVEILLAVRWVDFVTVFDEDTPIETIRLVRPDVLVKGAEYGSGEIVGEQFLNSYGGRTIRFPMRKGHATTDIIRRIERSADQGPPAKS
jgi:D-beta-D-heptose 7-phosphate kinase/D-beta-D-heptose 1-phosphate adenosyltransferase